MFRGLMKSEAVRRRVSWTIAAVLILPFLIYFHAGLQGTAQGPGGRAGKLFGKNIPWEAFQAQEEWVRRQWANQLGGSVPEEFGGIIAQQAWDRLILLEQARRRKLTVADAQLAAFIRQQAVFQQEGRFSSEHYKRVVRAVGLQPGAFEQRLREDLLIDKLVSSLKAATTITEADARAAFQQAHEQVRATVTLFDPADFAKAAAAEVTPESVQAEYDAHPERVREPERLTGEYAGLTRTALAERQQPTAEALQAHYASHAAEFRQDDGTAQSFDDVKEEIRRQLAETEARKALVTLTLDLEEDVKAARPFEEMVSARGLTRQPLGPVAVADLTSSSAPAEVREALRDLSAGQVSGVIETPEGVYVARVTERAPSTVPPLAQVRDAIEQRLKQDGAKRRAREAAEAWRAAASTGAPPQRPEARTHTATFTRTAPIEPLGAVSPVNQAAFATAIGELTGVLEANGRYVIVRPEERLPADEGKFAEEAQRWQDESLKKKQAEAFEQWLRGVRTQANLKSFVGTAPAR